MSKDYPRGKLRGDDDGQLAIAMTVHKNTLIIDFGKHVKWIGLGLQEVRMLRAKFEEYEKQLEANES